MRDEITHPSINFKVWDEITNPSINFNGATVEVSEWKIISSRILLGMWLVIHAVIKVSEKGPRRKHIIYPHVLTLVSRPISDRMDKLCHCHRSNGTLTLIVLTRNSLYTQFAITKFMSFVYDIFRAQSFSDRWETRVSQRLTKVAKWPK